MKRPFYDYEHTEIEEMSAYQFISKGTQGEITKIYERPRKTKAKRSPTTYLTKKERGGFENTGEKLPKHSTDFARPERKRSDCLKLHSTPMNLIPSNPQNLVQRTDALIEKYFTFIGVNSYIKTLILHFIWKHLKT